MYWEIKWAKEDLQKKVSENAGVHLLVGPPQTFPYILIFLFTESISNQKMRNWKII